MAEDCRKADINSTAFFNGKNKYAGPMPLEMKRLTELEHENERVKRIVADLSLKKQMLQDVIKQKL